MEIKCKCGSTKVFTETKGTQTGIYCSECGKWIKWATKEEIRLINHKGMSAEEKLDKIEQIVKRTEGTLGLDNYTIQQIKEVLNG